MTHGLKGSSVRMFPGMHIATNVFEAFEDLPEHSPSVGSVDFAVFGVPRLSRIYVGSSLSCFFISS